MSINSSLSKPNSIFWDQLHWQPSDKQLNQFIKFQSLLKYWNKKVNLTRLLKGDDYWIAHVYDSLWPFKKMLHQIQTKNLNFIDVGTGCGFPGIALAIAIPEAKIMLLDSSAKKTSVLKTITKEIGLESQVKIRNERVEITGQNNIQPIDLRREQAYIMAKEMLLKLGMIS